MLGKIHGRLSLLFIAFGLLVLISVSAMFWGLETQRQDALVINLAGRQRMLAQQMARLAFEAGEGEHITNAALQDVEYTFDQTLHALLDGGTAPYFSDTTVTLPVTRNPAIRSALDRVALTWSEIRLQVDKLQHTPRNDPSYNLILQLVEEKSSQLVEQADVVVRLYEADATAKVNRLRGMQNGFLAGALVLLGIGALITHLSVLKPLKVLSRAAVRLGRNDLDTPVQVESPEEMRLLSESFDSMRRNLRVSRQELVQLNDSLKDRVAQRTRELEMLNEVSREISSRLDIQQVLDSVTEKARTLVDGEVASLCLLDENRQWLKLQAISGEKSAVHGQAVRVEAGLAEAVLGSNEAMLCGVGACQGVCGMLTEPYRTSHVATPLRIGNQVIGALCVGSAAPGKFESESAKMLTKLANVAAIALENARLYSQVERVATLEERNRIAAEMHDGIGQTLSYLGLMTDQVVDFLSDGQNAEAIVRLQKARETINQAALDIRQTINQLLDEPPVNQNLCISLEETVKQFGLQHQLPIEWRNQLTSLSQCSRETAGQVTKIVLEALTNIVRHAEAKQVVVMLDKNEDEFQIIVKDDGQGFLVPTAKLNGHFGLQIMQARAVHIDGKVLVESQPGAGTQITLTWPVEQKGQP